MTTDAIEKPKEARKRARRVCFTHQIGPWSLELRQRKRDNFTVIYGLQVVENLDYTAAATIWAHSFSLPVHQF